MVLENFKPCCSLTCDCAKPEMEYFPSRAFKHKPLDYLRRLRAGRVWATPPIHHIPILHARDALLSSIELVHMGIIGMECRVRLAERPLVVRRAA